MCLLVSLEMFCSSYVYTLINYTLQFWKANNLLLVNTKTEKWFQYIFEDIFVRVPTRFERNFKRKSFDAYTRMYLFLYDFVFSLSFVHFW